MYLNVILKLDWTSRAPSMRNMYPDLRYGKSVPENHIEAYGSFSGMGRNS